MAVGDWSTEPGANTTIGGINIAENCPAGNINNAIREMMSEIAAWATSVLASIQPENPKVTALAALAGGDGQLPVFNGPNSFQQIATTAFMRGLFSAADGPSVATAIGAVRLVALTLADPGYVRFQVGPNQYIQIAWGSATFAANGGTNILYAANFPNAGFPLVSGAVLNTSAQDNGPDAVGGTAAANGFSAFSAANGPVTGYYIAVGY